MKRPPAGRVVGTAPGAATKPREKPAQGGTSKHEARARARSLLGGTAALIGAVAIASVLVVASPGSPLGGAAAPAPAAPGAVRSLRVSASEDRATITWQAPAGGTVANYEVEAFGAGGDFGTRITTATSITWGGLPLNQPVLFAVTPVGPTAGGANTAGANTAGANTAGGPSGPAAFTKAVTPSDSRCPSASSGAGVDCVVVDTTEVEGPEAHPGSGLLHGTVAAGNAYAEALHLTHWRITAGNQAEYANASAYGARNNIIEVLSDAWYNATSSHNGGYAADPWADWASYTNFIRAAVYYSEQAGQDPWWEIQNEPETYPYSPAEPPTRALVEEQYLYAYEAIEQTDPSARIVGPSIDWAYEDSAWPIDMNSFIAFAAAHGLHFAAIAWHDNCCVTDANPLPPDQTPEALEDQAEVVRTLVAENPGIGNPQLFVDENSSAAGAFSPGWEAGYLQAEDSAGITWGGRTCWGFPGDAPFDNADCFGPYLDQLLGKNGEPVASFWVLADYAAMVGNVVWSASTDPALSALAANNTAGTTWILLGRHQTCSGWTAGRTYCPVLTPPAPVATTIEVQLPAGATSAKVSLQAIADTTSPMPTPPPETTTTIPASHGIVTVRIPSFADGAAYFLRVTAGA